MLSKRMLFMVALGAGLFIPAGVRGEDNKALVRRMTEEVFNKGNVAAAEEFVAPTIVVHRAGVPDAKGLDGFKQAVSALRTAFPDLHLTIEDMVGEGDKVAVRFTYHGTQKGEFRGVAASGKEMTWTTIIIDHIVNGKIQEVWNISDLGRQLRLVSPPGQSKP
jgi:steroid delta-isomerase-like uncharacterized protein